MQHRKKDPRFNRWLITGGTGSLGQRLVPYILEQFEPELVTVFSRNEYEQYAMWKRYPDVHFVIGDVRDYDAVYTECRRGYQYVIHAAALKHVRTAQRQPQEATETNIDGTANVAAAANEVGATMVLISTDKAVEPTTEYGATKMLAERIALIAGQRVVRYGNVFGSRGSVLHTFRQLADNGHVFHITDSAMTRFVITFEQAVELVCRVVTVDWMGEDLTDTMAGRWEWDVETGALLVVPNLPAIRIVDLARAFDDDAQFEEIGIQPGEKLAESLLPGVSSDNAEMLSVEEIRRLIDESV